MICCFIIGILLKNVQASPQNFDGLIKVIESVQAIQNPGLGDDAPQIMNMANNHINIQLSTVDNCKDCSAGLQTQKESGAQQGNPGNWEAKHDSHENPGNWEAKHNSHENQGNWEAKHNSHENQGNWEAKHDSHENQGNWEANNQNQGNWDANHENQGNWQAKHDSHENFEAKHKEVHENMEVDYLVENMHENTKAEENPPFSLLNVGRGMINEEKSQNSSSVPISSPAAGFPVISQSFDSLPPVTSQAASNEALVASQAASNEALVASQAASNEALVASQAASNEAIVAFQVAGNEALVASQAASNEAIVAFQVAGNRALVTAETANLTHGSWSEKMYPEWMYTVSNKTETYTEEKSDAVENNATVNHEFEERNYDQTVLICGGFNYSLKGDTSTETMEAAIDSVETNLKGYMHSNNNSSMTFKIHLPIFYEMSYPIYPDFRFSICYWLAQNTEKDAFPEPLSPELVLMEKPKSTMYVRSFSGPGGEQQGKVWGEETEKLRSDLIKNDLPFSKADSFAATFSLPEETNNRRDEVMFMKQADVAL